MDCGLILTKPGVSLEKEPGRTGILGPKPLDLDLGAQICSSRVLIAGVHAGSDGSGQGPSGRRRNTAGAELRSGELAGEGVSGATELRLGRSLAVEGQH